jgi:hypothetical protein
VRNDEISPEIPKIDDALIFNVLIVDASISSMIEEFRHLRFSVVRVEMNVTAELRSLITAEPVEILLALILLTEKVDMPPTGMKSGVLMFANVLLGRIIPAALSVKIFGVLV